MPWIALNKRSQIKNFANGSHTQIVHVPVELLYVTQYNSMFLNWPWLLLQTTINTFKSCTMKWVKDNIDFPRIPSIAISNTFSSKPQWTCVLIHTLYHSGRVCVFAVNIKSKYSSKAARVIPGGYLGWCLHAAKQQLLIASLIHTLYYSGLACVFSINTIIKMLVIALQKQLESSSVVTLDDAYM